MNTVNINKKSSTFIGQKKELEQNKGLPKKLLAKAL
jgi:hypothetical protein